jgi:non-ribosomal peptide synthetase component F
LNDGAFIKPNSGSRTGSLEANRMQCVIEEDLVKGLEGARSEYSISLFNLLLTAFFKALSGNSEVGKWTVGVPMATRNFSNTTRTVGNCVNILPIVVDMANSSDEKQFVQVVKARLHKAYSHMDVPYMHLLSMQDKPLFNVTFNMEPVQELPSFGNARVELVMARNAYSEFPIMFNLLNLGGRIIVEVDYQIAFYDAEQVRLLMDNFLREIKNISEPNTMKIKSDEGEALCQ